MLVIKMVISNQFSNQKTEPIRRLILSLDGYKIFLCVFRELDSISFLFKGKNIFVWFVYFKT